MKKLVLIICTLLLWACRPSGVRPNCEELDRDLTTGYVSVFHYPLFSVPCFNPSNGEEFVYLVDLGEDEKELRIFNIPTSEERVLVTGNIRSQPDWGANGWIIFSTNWNHLWKIHESGDSLTQLSDQDIHEDARWNQDGSEYIAWVSTADTTFVGIFDVEGTLIQLISKPYRNGAWAPQSSILSAFRPVGAENLYIGKYEPAQSEIIEFPLESVRNVLDISHFKNQDEFIYSLRFDNKTNQLAIGNFTTQKSKEILKGCETDYWRYFSYSIESDKIVLERYQKEVRDTIRPSGSSLPALHHFRSIWIGNSDGTDLRQVLP